MCPFSPTEKPVWYFEGWRRSACTAVPSSAARISKAAQTPWHISTAGAKKVDLSATHGTALYMTAAPHAWKSSFLCNVTRTATRNFDESGSHLKQCFSFIYFFQQDDITDGLNLFSALFIKCLLWDWCILKTRRDLKRNLKKPLDIGLKLPRSQPL